MRTLGARVCSKAVRAGQWSALGLAVAAGAALSAIRFPLPMRPSLPAPHVLGAWLHMALALVLGLAMAGAVLRWMQGIAAAATQ